MTQALTSFTIQEVVAITHAAGKTVLGLYGQESGELTLKPGNSPVTEADLTANELILSGLRKLAPKVPTLSEESGTAPYEERRRWNVYWLVDPLDGTKEFIKHIGEFTVNVALIEHDHPVLGVVHAPALGLTYFAARGQKPFRQKSDEAPTPIKAADYSGGELRVAISRSHGQGAETNLSQVPKECRCVPMGSSLKFCLVADGTVHLYPRLGPTMEWDTAAGQAVLEAAGGRVVTANGDPLRYGKVESGLRNPSFIAWGLRTPDAAG